MTTAQDGHHQSSDPAIIQQIMDAIPNPVFYKDKNGIYTGCNKAFEAYLGKNRDEIVGKGVFDMAPKDLAERYHAQDIALLKQGTQQTYESQVRYADGTLHDVIFNKAVFKGADGSPAGIVGIILDITERKALERALMEKNTTLEEMQQELEKTNLDLILAYNEVKEAQIRLIQSEKMATIGQLAAGMAHEINNPMGFITSNLGTLESM